VLKCSTFEIVSFEKYYDLETWARGHYRTLKMAAFDRSQMASYSCSIVTLVLICTVSEI